MEEDWDLAEKAKALEQLLSRCSSLAEGPRRTATQQENEVKALKRRIAELEHRVSTLKQYNDKLESEVRRDENSVRTLGERSDSQQMKVDSATCTDADPALILVFQYLSMTDLCRASAVCKAWRTASTHPSLWKRIFLSNARVTTKMLRSIAKLCSSTECIELQGIIPQPARGDEELQSYIDNQRAQLEPGLYDVLKKCNKSLKSVTIGECSLLVTERVLWMLSLHCPRLLSLRYQSNEFPVTSESLWSLANGCGNLQELYLMPTDDENTKHYFNDRCIAVISKGFPRLVRLSIGGSITVQGLASLGHHQRLQHLQIIRGPRLSSVDIAVLAPPNTFRCLITLALINTRITPQAIVSIIDTHSQIQKIDLVISITDYFKSAIDQTSFEKYQRILDNLHTVANNGSYGKIFDLWEEPVRVTVNK